MTFRFTVPGQPPTGNLLYDTVWRMDGAGRRYPGRAKKAGVIEYQALVEREARRALPRGWNPGPWDPKAGIGLIAVRIWFYLARPVDADNAFKVINDGVKLGLGTQVARSRSGKLRLVPTYDDARFMGQAWWLQTGFGKEAHIDVEIIAPWPP